MIYNNFDLEETLTRREFEEFNMDLFTKCMDIVQRTLEDAKLNKTEIDDIVLVGGSTRIPKVQELLKQFFDNKKELSGTINPDEAVARGAAIQAALLHGEQAILLRDFVQLTDVTAFSLGTEDESGHLSVIVPKHTKIPWRHTETFVTTVTNQTRLSFDIYEGENTKADENTLLGNFVLKNIPPAPAGGREIECTMTVNEEGILNVKAVCVSNGLGRKIPIEVHNGRMTQEELQNSQNSETAGPSRW